MTSKHLKKIESSGVLFELNGNYDRLIPEKAIKEYSPALPMMTLAGVGSRATSSRTTTTHPALRWAPYLEQGKRELRK